MIKAAAKTVVVNLKRGEPYDVYIGRAGRGEPDGTFGKPRWMGGLPSEWKRTLWSGSTA